MKNERNELGELMKNNNNKVFYSFTKFDEDPHYYPSVMVRVSETEKHVFVFGDRPEINEKQAIAHAEALVVTEIIFPLFPTFASHNARKCQLRAGIVGIKRIDLPFCPLLK
jgi:hypothetical protein